MSPSLSSVNFIILRPNIGNCKASETCFHQQATKTETWACTQSSFHVLETQKGTCREYICRFSVHVSIRLAEDFTDIFTDIRKSDFTAKKLILTKFIIEKKKKVLCVKCLRQKEWLNGVSSKAKFLLTSPSVSGPELILLIQNAFFFVWVLYTRITLKGRRNKNILSIKLLKPHSQWLVIG